MPGKGRGRQVTTATAHVELSTDALTGLTHREYVGVLALSLAAWDPYPGVTWEELAHAILGRVEDAKWRSTSLISDTLDRMAEVNQ